MAISLTHNFVSAKTDSADATLVQPSNWNAEHVLEQATARLLGRTTLGSGPTEEISVNRLDFSAGVLALPVVVSFDEITVSTFIDTPLIQNSSEIVFHVNGGDRVRIDDQGDLGVGVAEATARLHIKGNTVKFEEAAGSRTLEVSPATDVNLFNRFTASGNDSGYLFTSSTGSEFLRINAASSVSGSILASKVEAEAGSIDNRLMTPLRTAQAIEALVIPGVGDGQEWQDMIGSRTYGTNYQNTTGRPIEVSIVAAGNNRDVEVHNGSSWIPVGRISNVADSTIGFTVPAGRLYRITGSTTIIHWSELR